MPQFIQKLPVGPTGVPQFVQNFGRLAFACDDLYFMVAARGAAAVDVWAAADA